MHFNGPSPDPEQLQNFAVFAEHAEFRPLGNVSLSQAVDLVTTSIKHARDSKQTKLRVDISRLTGFESPNISQRYTMIREWAEIARGHLRMAMVARQEIIDPQKFGVIVAQNAGMTTNIFASESEALEWLRNTK